ncbi:MFS transporter [Kitasatospora sp. NA04385]|uniref:MFS transporter n=1 Tax=Kitasatospora sp. NA04385 TaxID=2742135 RepID=UPI0015921DA3|nr:MFS transporter [Kitasatospora sp. NA04385]QKW22825.1 MFS transporter [Kitasatospora sp. NA04385]
MTTTPSGTAAIPPSTGPTGPAEPAGAAGVRRTETLVLAWVSVCTVLVVGLVAAINLAVPMLAAGPLHPSPAQLLWIVDAYVLVFACLVIPGGAAGDRFGRKGALLAGLLAFAAGAALTAAAPSTGVMLVGRVVSGVGAALVLPNGVGVLVHATRPERRGRALALWGAVAGLGGLIGNLGGGALLSSGSWRLLFWAVVPLALACALGVALTVRRSGRSPRSLDPAGTTLLVLATVALLVGIIEGPGSGWASPLVVGAFAVSALLWTAWVLVGLRTAHPLLDPRLFRIPMLSAASLGMFVMFFGSFALFYLNASLLQYGRGFSLLQTGVAILPLVLPMIVGARFAPALAERIGFAATLLLAFGCLGGGLFGLASAAHAGYPLYALWLVVIGTGFALAMPVLTVELTSSLPAHRAGVAGGLQSATRELGSALGVAVAGTVLTSVFASALPAAARGRHSVPAALAAAPADRSAVLDAFVTGAASALHVAGAVTLAAGAVVVLAARRAGRTD